jgi:hypothetical protein
MEFAFWALIIVGGAAALIMLQHAQHSVSIVNAVANSPIAKATGGVQTIPETQGPATGQIPPVPFGFFDFEGNPGYP